MRDVAKMLETVEKLNKLKVKTIAALTAVPSLPERVLSAVVAAIDADDVKEIAGQFIAKVAAAAHHSTSASDCPPQEKSASSLASQAQAVPGVAAAANLLMAQQRQWIFADFGALRMKSECNGRTLQDWIVICLADLLSHSSDLRARMQPHIDYCMVCAKVDASHSQSANTGPSAVSHGRFDHYSNFSRQLSAVQSHQALALLRGDKEGALKLSFEIDLGCISDRIRGWFWRDYRGHWEKSGLCKLANDIVTEGLFAYFPFAQPTALSFD